MRERPILRKLTFGLSGPQSSSPPPSLRTFSSSGVERGRSLRRLWPAFTLSCLCKMYTTPEVKSRPESNRIKEGPEGPLCPRGRGGAVGRAPSTCGIKESSWIPRQLCPQEPPPEHKGPGQALGGAAGELPGRTLSPGACLNLKQIRAQGSPCLVIIFSS